MGALDTMEGTIKYCLLLFIIKLSHSADDSTTEEFWPGKDCPVDPAIGLDDPNNVFSCKPEEECCTKNLKPACCAAMPTDMMIQDQIELWVPLAVIITLLGLFVWFCRSDQSLLDAETPCLQKFCCCLGYKKRGDDGHLHIISEDLGSSTSLKSEKSAIVSIEDDAEVVAVEDNAANLEAVLEPEAEEELSEENIDNPEEVTDEAPEEAETGEEEAAPGDDAAEDSGEAADGGDEGDGGDGG